MIFHLLFLFHMSLALPDAAQDPGVPVDLSGLVSVAQRTRNLLAAGQMLEAVEFVLPEKRNDVLAAGRATFRNPRVVGVDLTDDPDRVIVRVALEMLPGITAGARRDWVARDPWVRRDGTWYFDPGLFRDVLRSGNVVEALDVDSAEVEKDFESNFRLVDSFIDVGTLNHGDRKVLSVRIEYSGTSPIRIEAPIQSRLLALDRASTAQVSAGTEDIKLVIDTEGWEGPFRIPLPLKVHYQGGVSDRILTVVGNVFVPLTFRSDPEWDRPSEGEFRFLLRNNSSQAVEISYVTVDGTLAIVGHSKRIEAAGDGFIHLQRLPGVEPTNEVTVVLREPLLGKRVYEFPFDFGPPA